MKLIYHIAMNAYQAGLRLVATKKPKAKLMVEGHERVEAYLKANRNPDEEYYWFHAASLGEFEQGRPLIEAIKKLQPKVKIALSFFSPSGYEIRKNYAGADLIFYLPIDTESNARKVIDLLKPSKAFFIKYEFWANYLYELKKHHVPTYLVSAIFRREQVFFKFYGGFFRKLLPLYSQIFVQDETSAQLLAGLSLDHVSQVGDTRFDRVLEIQGQAKALPEIKRIFEARQFVLVAGSSWGPDEDLLIPYYNHHPEMGLIIAPHEIHQEHIQAIISKLKHPYVLYSDLLKHPEMEVTASCLIVDTIGILSSIYQFADVAYIGGGFGVGIHNTLEAAVYGVPVVFGPNYQRFKEACDLIDLKGAYSINDYASLAEQLDLFEKDIPARQQAGQQAGNYVKQFAGASEKIIQAIGI